jgi:hypothetical protein
MAAWKSSDLNISLYRGPQYQQQHPQYQQQHQQQHQSKAPKNVKFDKTAKGPCKTGNACRSPFCKFTHPKARDKWFKSVVEEGKLKVEGKEQVKAGIPLKLDRALELLEALKVDIVALKVAVDALKTA